MRIALIGYGKMGHTIEEVARERGHQVVCVIDRDNQEDFDSEAFASADVAIEFTTPATAEANIRKAWSKGRTSPTPPKEGLDGCSESPLSKGGGEVGENMNIPAPSIRQGGLPVVCGTTGWDVEQFVMRNAQCIMENALVWSSNYSIGVNILFALNRQLAEIMSKYSEYQPSITEVHHVHKLDAPSGTAKTLAEQISLTPQTSPTPPSKEWLSEQSQNSSLGEEEGVVKKICVGGIPITSIREGEVPGIHTVTWDSDVDTISISHSAKSRKGFALGAVLAAEWIIGKRGFHTMEEVLDLPNPSKGGAQQNEK